MLRCSEILGQWQSLTMVRCWRKCCIIYNWRLLLSFVQPYPHNFLNPSSSPALRSAKLFGWFASIVLICTSRWLLQAAACISVQFLLKLKINQVSPMGSLSSHLQLMETLVVHFLFDFVWRSRTSCRLQPAQIMRLKNLKQWTRRWFIVTLSSNIEARFAVQCEVHGRLCCQGWTGKDKKHQAVFLPLCRRICTAYPHLLPASAH